MVSRTSQLPGLRRNKTWTRAAPIRPKVCHLDACSLAQVQLWLALLIAPAVTRGAEDAAAARRLLAAATVFKDVEQAVLQMHAAMPLFHLQL